MSKLPSGIELARALELAKHCAKCREIAGAHVDYPYNPDQLAGALITIAQFVGYATPVSNDAHIRVKRQLTAALARLAKHGERSGSGELS